MADQSRSVLKPSRARSSIPEPPTSSAGSLHGPACVNESMSHASTGELGTPSPWTPDRAPAPSLQHRPGWERDVHWDNSSCSMLKLDQEMTMFESFITRTVSDHLSQELIESPPASLKSIKRKRSESDGSGWVHPLKLLVRKGLTQSDVGELGRIIIPKKDAEKQAFPQIDTKEGTVLEMEDYNASKRWFFRFKYWINNKSRMYVLENTGDFIKYHDLKEHDTFVVYEDGCKNLVVCGQKKSSSRNSDPSIEPSNPSTELSNSSIELSNPSIEPSNPSIKLPNPAIELSNPSIELSNPSIELSNSSIEVSNLSIELSNGETPALETPLIITEDVNQCHHRHRI